MAEPAKQQKPSDEYAKGLKDSAKIGEVIQLVERGVAPGRAGVKLAILLSFISLVVSIVAAGTALVRLSP